MRTNLPPGVADLREFGAVIRWGRRNKHAIDRISTLTRGELEAVGITGEQAMAWAIAYEAVVMITPDNPSARGGAELMRHAAKLLGQAE